MDPILLDLPLARQIELAEAQAGAAAAEALGRRWPGRAAVERIAGGYALYAGPGSPVTQAVALGLEGAVSEEEFLRLEEFYRARNEPVRVEACPLADQSLFERFGRAGYRATEFTNVMAMRLPAGTGGQAAAGEIAVARAGREEIPLWAATVAQGFAEGQAAQGEVLPLLEMFALAEGVECYLAFVNGEAAGGATLSLRNGVAGLFGASTLPAFRRRGVQAALLRARLARGLEAGCGLAACLAQPATSSARNIERQGFRVLYTRVKFASRESAG